VSASEQDRAAKRAQWEEINRAKALAKQQQKESSVQTAATTHAPKKQFQTVTGTRDLMPPDTSLWSHVEKNAHEIFGTFGFGEIRVPILEPTDLFARAVGGDTDIVSKEMFRLADLPEDETGRALAYLQLMIRSAAVSSQYPEQLEDFCKKVEKFLADYASARGRNLVYQSDSTDRRFQYLQSNLEGLRKLQNENGGPDFQHKFDETIGYFRNEIGELALTEPKTLRPEATASVCRAYIEHSLFQLPQPVRLYYIGPMFRRERPQKGRYRQFYQIGAEVLGGNDAPAIDAEVIEMVMTFFDKLELPGLKLDINSIGHNAPDCRPKYVELLREELRKVKDQLGADSQRRIETNPLRVLDSKLESEQAIIAKLPRIANHLCDACKAHYAEVKKQLQLRGVIYHENWRLVRGLDYYMRTTFEITAKGLGSQNAVCGGGRYDGLVELLGGPPTKGIGFAIGEDRLILSLQDAGKVPARQGRDVYIAWMGEHAYAEAVRTAKMLRSAGHSVELPPTELKFGKALERASKLDSRYALILGDNEVSEGFYTLKTLADGTQQKFTEPELLEFLQSS
jgi:histidyl-tRNA synthetase